MRRFLVILFVIALTTSFASAAQARVGGSLGADSGSLELQEGDGTIVVSFARGAIYGQFDRGRLTITTRRGASPEIEVWGAETVSDGRDRATGKERATVYRGLNIRFKVAGTGWRVGIQGFGINASMVGRGVATVKGEGLLSVDGEEFTPWPLEFQSFALGG